MFVSVGKGRKKREKKGGKGGSVHVGTKTSETYNEYKHGWMTAHIYVKDLITVNHARCMCHNIS